MIHWVDDLLNKITMYRLVLYGTIALWVYGVALSGLNLLPYNPLDLLSNLIYIMAVCFFMNYVCALVWKAPTNLESVYITAVILALIVTPQSISTNIVILSWISVLAMASKYIIAIRYKHLLNPAACAVAITGLTLGSGASWWIANIWMTPASLIVGCLILHKIKKFDLGITAVSVAVITTLGFAMINGSDLLRTLNQILIYSPLFFFVGVMLTEPMTIPPRRRLRIWYGIIVGVLFAPAIHIGSLYSTPELALIVGNLFVYAVSSKQKLILRLVEKITVATDTVDFVFTPERPYTFEPGQYLEWTLPHHPQDNRGMRRFFTIASSPTEPSLRLGVKFYPNPSTYKKKLLALQPGDTIVAGQLAGDFVLPKNTQQPIICIAGGIGVTPFRSMWKDLLDHHQARPLILFYSNKLIGDIAYTDVFDAAQQQLGIRTIYTLTDTAQVPADWKGYTGMITPEMIQTEVPHYKKCLFYISGPRPMILAFQHSLTKLGIPRRHIKTDFFPGFA